MSTDERLELSKVKAYKRVSKKSGKIVDVGEYVNKIQKKVEPLHLGQNRPPMTGVPGQFPAGRATPNVWPHELEAKHPKPTLKDATEKVKDTQSDIEHASSLIEKSKEKALPGHERLAKAAGMTVKRAPHPKVQESIDALKEAGWEVKEEKPDKETGKIRPRTPTQLHLLQKATGKPVKTPKTDPSKSIIEKSAVTALVGKGRPDGAGTEDDPIDVQGDFDRAVKLLAEGKHIRLNQTREISTLVDKLAAMAKEAKAKGAKAPDLNLCLVSLPGTNIFCYENKGIPRINMPQLAGEAVPGTLADKKKNAEGFADLTDDFIKHLSDTGVKLTSAQWPVAEMRSTQRELSGPKVAALAKLMEEGKKFPGAVFVSRDGYILDGHHRWAGELAQDVHDDGVYGDLKMDVRVIDMDVMAALDLMNKWTAENGIKSQGITDKFGGTKAVKKTVDLPNPKVPKTPPALPATTQGAASDLLSRAKEGGFTFDVHGQKPVEHGVVVAVKGHTRIFKPESFNAEELSKYIGEKADLLAANPNMHLGGWYDKEHGEVVLDLVEVHDRDTAIKLGKERGEQAVFDLDKLEEIPTGGTGGREEAANHAVAAPEAVEGDVGGGAQEVRGGVGGKDPAEGLLVPRHTGLRPATPEDRKRLKVPPAWKDVQVSDDPTNPLTVAARDTAGRPKYLYVDAYHAQQAALKYARQKDLHAKIDVLDTALAKDAKTDDTAAALLLIRRTGLRQGSTADRKAKVQAYGATTLLAKHVKVATGGKVHLDFIGKEGKHLVFDVEDPELATVLRSRLKGKGPEDRVFATSAAKTNAYLTKTLGGDFVVKDLRTYHANALALQEIAKIKEKPKTLVDFKKVRLAIAKVVAAHLGNEPSMTLKAYINPVAFSSLIEGHPEWSKALAA